MYEIGLDPICDIFEALCFEMSLELGGANAEADGYVLCGGGGGGVRSIASSFEGNACCIVGFKVG